MNFFFKVCISRLTRNVTKDHIQEIFAHFGSVRHVEFNMRQDRSWINSGTAYVTYEKPEEAEECIKKMNGGK